MHRLSYSQYSQISLLCNQVGVSDWAKAGENGVKEYSPNFPYRLRFHPTGEFTFPPRFQQQCQIDNLCDLRTIPAGSTLFQVGHDTV